MLKYALLSVVIDWELGVHGSLLDKHGDLFEFEDISIRILCMWEPHFALCCLSISIDSHCEEWVALGWKAIQLGRNIHTYTHGTPCHSSLKVLFERMTGGCTAAKFNCSIGRDDLCFTWNCYVDRD